MEVASALARLVRQGELSNTDQARARRRLQAARKRWYEITASDPVREIAIELPDRRAVRAADALQLAAALVWCGGKPRHRSFVCLDERLNAAAAAEGFDVIVPE